MKAIFTKYLGATNNKGSRVKAYDADQNQVTLHWDSDQSPEENHKRACTALMAKMDWFGRMAMGSHKDVYVFVFVETESENEMMRKTWLTGPNWCRYYKEQGVDPTK